jgi:chorismate--pyruvate lyase
MFCYPSWNPHPPRAAPALTRWLTDQGSLTERLIATGQPFSVRVLHQGADSAQDDEAALIGLAPGAGLHARQVALELDGLCVVVARSITRLDSRSWISLLERGRRSLGLTLFGPDHRIVRKPLLYREIQPDHPLFILARGQDPSQATRYPARRSNFILDGAALNVCEIFLPALENFL